MTICPSDPDTCHTIQRYVLAVFYFSSEGYRWAQCSAPSIYDCDEEIENANNNCAKHIMRHNSNDRIGSLDTDAWLTTSHECNWGGVACHGESTMPELAYCLDQIDFQANNLAGTIPDEVGSLKSMRYLYLELGNMSGTIPAAVGTLGNLEAIDLGTNALSGDIPQEIYGLSSLRELKLNNNKLTGTISTQIGSLDSLRVLNLNRNLLEGGIPKEVGQLDQVIDVFFSYNNFSGQVASEICDLQTGGSLEKLKVDCLREVVCDCCTSCS